MNAPISLHNLLPVSGLQQGTDVIHESAHLHVTGGATFTDDMPELAGTLYAAITYTLKGGKLSNVKLAYNGLAPSPCRAPKLEAVLEGKAPADVKESDLDAAIADSFVARDGLRATWAYRSLVARNLVIDFIEEQTQSTAEVA